MAKVVNLSLARKQAQVRIDVVQYTTAPDIVFIIEDYTPTGRADFYIEKPSGEEIYNHCTIDGNKVIFTPTTQCFAEVGEQKAQLQILDGEKMAVSFPIQLVVAENIIDSSAAESQSEFTELQDAISTIGQYDQRIQDVQDDMAALETQLTDDMAALQTNVTQQLNAAITSVEGDITTLQTDLDALDTRTTSLEEGAFIFRRRLYPTDDLNDVLEHGVYVYYTNEAPQNAPYPNPSIVEVIRVNDGRIIQRVTRYAAKGQSSFRAKNGDTWLAWERYAVGTDVDTLTSNVNTLNSAVQGINERVQYFVPADAALSVRPDGTTVSFTGGSYNLSKEKYGGNGQTDTVTLTGSNYAGCITNSSKSIDFFIPMPKSCAGRSVEANITKLTARYYDGYVNGNANLPASAENVIMYPRENGIGVRVNAANSGTWKLKDGSTTFTNNGIVAVGLDATLYIY